jgi:erythromycin esterase-like protein
MTSKKVGPCPSCIFVEQYNKDGSFAAFMDYQHRNDVFMRQVKSIIELLLTGTFEDGVGIRIPKRHGKAYFKTGLGLLGFPDVAAVVETDANEAKKLLRNRLDKLVEWSMDDLDCERRADKRITGALSRWKEHAGELSKCVPQSRELLRLVN